MTYTTSITKTKAAQYDLPGIKDMVQNIWSPVKVAYDKHALWGISYWRDQRKTFYGYARGLESTHDVYSTKRILAVTRVENRLTNLSGDDVSDFAITLRMFTRSMVIQKRVKDLQLGVKRYYKKINITKPETTRPGLMNKDPYNPYQDPQGFIYVDTQGRNRLMRSDELYKFSDGTLTRLQTSLDDITKNIRMEYLTQRRWSSLEKKRANFMIKAIDKQLKERRMMRSLKKFVGRRHYVVRIRYLFLRSSQNWRDLPKDIPLVSVEVHSFGSKMWKPTLNTPPLPPIIPKMPGRIRKKRVRHPVENDKGGIKISDVGGSSSKNVAKDSRSNVVKEGMANVVGGGGSVGKGGGSNMGRGGGSNRKKGGGSTISKGGGSSSKRGGESVGRGGGSNMGRGGGSNSKRGGGLTTSRGSGSNSKRGGGSNSFNTEDERQLALDEEASREVFAEVKVIIEKEMIKIEQNGRIYQDCDDLRSDDFRNDPDITTPLNFLTISELEAAYEAHDVYFNNMDSITTATQTANNQEQPIIHVISADNVSNNEQPTIHPPPKTPDTSSQSSRVVLHPRPRYERIAKKRKLVDGTIDKPFTL
ncbi:hypothetical protein Tco_0687825 [Tanacetum coccineum]